MGNFELTERGKIIIAVVLVLLLLVIPALVILGFSSCGTSPEDSPPVMLETPLPTPGSGVNPSDPQDEEMPEPSPKPDPEPFETPEPTPSPTPLVGEGDISSIDSPPEYGPVGLNLTEGTMLFIFSPDEQDELDADTVDMIEEFLSSPMNTRGALVRVDMPHISSEDEAILMTAVTKAFSRYGIGKSGLLFAMGSATVEERYFEVALSFAEPVKSPK